DFERWQQHRDGAPKSSLDGARVSVLRSPKKKWAGDPGPIREAKLARQYRIPEGEHLDAVGLVKRAGGGRNSSHLQFVPIFNVALAPWVGEGRRSCAKALDHAIDEAKGVGVASIERRIPCGKPLCEVDAGIFLRSRWWPQFEEQGIFEPPGLQDER